MSKRVIEVAVVGARGYTGAELLRLLAGHPHLRVTLVSSRSLVGQRVRDVIEGLSGDLRFSAIEPADVARHPEIGVWVLALPNGISAPWVKAIEAARPDAAIVDLSADHRFDAEWRYGLPELHRRRLIGARRIANPGCYATGAQLAIAGALHLLEGAPHVFGVSGYSGAGTTPSPKNDRARLADNLMPYALTGHTHEAEIRWHLGHRVFFMPHVAPFFRGITLTVSMRLREPLSREEVLARYVERYESEPMVRVVADVPEVKDAAGRHFVTLGGFAVDAAERHLVVVATLDNLLKGAATQAVQNMNLAWGLDELAGIRQHLV